MSEPKAQGTSATTYIDWTHQLQQPLGHRPLTNDEAAVVLVDEIWMLYQTFKHTRQRADLLRMVTRALYLEKLGYQLILVRRHNCVGAHRKETGCPIVH